MTVSLGRVLASLLVLTACSGARAARQTTDDQTPEATAADEPVESDHPHGSGATAYVPPKSTIAPGTIDRLLLERALAAGPGWLLSEVPLQPTFAAKHKFSGFKLLSVFRNDPKVLRYGILPGDIVRSVNGQKIVTPGDLLLVFERLKTADTLEIDVQRAGVDQQFRFPIVPALGLAAIAPPPVDSTPPTAR